MNPKLSALGGRIRLLLRKDPDTATENPYLNARRTWNLAVGSAINRGFIGTMVGGFGMVIALAAVGGMVHIGSQSRFVPYVYVERPNGETQPLGVAVPVSPASPLVINAAVRDFITDARTVTPDVALQRKAIERVYAKLLPSTAARTRMDEWFASDPPFKRAAKVVVSVDRATVLLQSPTTMQVDWEEVTHDRQGSQLGAVRMRALVTFAVATSTPINTPDAELALNPARVFVSDFSWTQIK